MALLVVLLLISMALGLSYAAMRSQYMALLIHRNFDRRASARQAAVTGLTIAIKKMHKSDWAGVDTTLTGSLGSYESFQVTYTTGDQSLHSGHPDYENFPYRVTLLSTGYAADPDNPTCIATHQIRAVVRLIPRALADEPANWDEMMKYVLYQYKDRAFKINVPFRVEGPVRVQKKLRLAEAYPWSNSARERYLGDLNAMRLTGYPDWRPFDGPIDLPYNEQSAGTIALLGTAMGIPTSDVHKQNATDWSHPGSLTTYQIYTGGKTYSVQTLSGSLSDVTLEPDPETNPLGIYYRSGRVWLHDNVTVRGTLVVKGSWNGDVFINGKNVHLVPHDLPPLENTDVPIQLPVMVLQDDFRIYPDADVSVTGMLTIWDEFEVKSDNQHDMVVAIQGRVVAEEILIRRRCDWVKWTDWWTEEYDEFTDQDEEEEEEEEGIPYFPVWLNQVHGLDPNPRLTIKPESNEVRYHWKKADDPVYVPHPDDDGLRWDLLEWTENQ